MLNQLFRILALTSLLNTLGFAVGANPIPAAAFDAVFIPPAKSDWELTIGGLYLKPGASNLGWAAVTTVLPIPTPNWQILTINPSYQADFQVGGRYNLHSSGTDIQLNWTRLHTTDNTSVGVNRDSQWVSPFSQTGTTPTTTEITGVAQLKTANAQVNFNYDVINLDAGKTVSLGSNLQMRIFTGLSGVQIREEIYSNFYGSPQPTLSFNNTSTFIGIGPRLGVNNAYDIYHGMQLIFQFAGSLLVGSMQPAQYEFTGTSNPLAVIGISKNRESIASDKETQVVPAVDTKLGVNYRYAFRNAMMTFELGYMWGLYINPLSSYETNTNVIALDTGSLSTASVRHTQSNFSYNGPYLTASCAL